MTRPFSWKRNRAFVWTNVSSWNPDDNNVLSIHYTRFDDRQVGWLYEFTFVDKFLVDKSMRPVGSPQAGRTGRPVRSSTPRTIYSPTSVVDVVCKCADGVQHSLWIPIRLVFYPCGFNNPLIQKQLNIDWQ